MNVPPVIHCMFCNRRGDHTGPGVLNAKVMPEHAGTFFDVSAYRPLAMVLINDSVARGIVLQTGIRATVDLGPR